MQKKISVSIESAICDKIQDSVNKGKATSFSKRVELLLKLGMATEKMLEDEESKSSSIIEYDLSSKKD